MIGGSRRAGASRFCCRLVAAALVAVSCSAGNKAADVQGTTVAQVFPGYADRAVRVERGEMSIYDGDTFETGGMAIRILGMDTPEIRNPRHGFYVDQPFGRDARAKAIGIFDSADVIEYVPYQPDRYGRMLAHVFVDGELFAVKMIEAGLAYETVTFYGDNGFSDLAEEILRAADMAGKPSFREPYHWRNANRREPPPSFP